MLVAQAVAREAIAGPLVGVGARGNIVKIQFTDSRPPVTNGACREALIDGQPLLSSGKTVAQFRLNVRSVRV